MTKLEAFINKRQKDSPFIKMADFAANKAGHHATVLTKNLHKECTSIYDEVFNQFGGLMEEAEDKNGHVAAVKTELHKYLQTADTKMAMVVAELKAIEKTPYIKPESDSNKPGSDKIKKEKKQHQRNRRNIKSEF